MWSNRTRCYVSKNGFSKPRTRNDFNIVINRSCSCMFLVDIFRKRPLNVTVSLYDFQRVCRTRSFTGSFTTEKYWYGTACKCHICKRLTRRKLRALRIKLFFGPARRIVLPCKTYLTNNLLNILLLVITYLTNNYSYL